jgi:hypothetical protein
MFDIEMTDTFGGDANYCWVVRDTIKAKTMSGALRAFKRKRGITARTRKEYDIGEMRRYKIANANVCIFVMWSAR